MKTNSASWDEALLASLKGIREPRQRVLKLAEQLMTHTPHEIGSFLHNLYQNSCVTNNDSTRLFLDLLRHNEVLADFSYETRVEIYEFAAEEGWTELQLLLRSKQALPGEIEEKPDVYQAKLSGLTLGERKALSRNVQRSKFEFLFFDEDPMVIRELLRNPKLTERDVVRIASRRQAPPEILEEVLKSDRWMNQYSVRKALSFNPQTPLSYMPALVSGLRRLDLRLLLTSGRQESEVRALIEEKLRP